MKNYSLAIAWNWEFDDDFIGGVERACSSRGLTTYRIESHNIKETMLGFRNGVFSFRTFYDRASDTDDLFEPVAQLLQKESVRTINQLSLVHHASDKATMHLELITHGVHVPYTIIVSPYNKKKEIEFSLTELEHLGRPFIIKPANTTGGGTGVVLGAETLKDVIESRQHHKNDKYLLQEKIEPIILNGHRAWFRVFYAFGKIIPCWWNDLTHIYRELNAGEEQQFGLGDLRTVMQQIYEVCKLDFFSSEIAMTADRKLIVVDYVNEICDMRLQSKYSNGVPDAVVMEIQRLIAHDVEIHERRFVNHAV